MASLLQGLRNLNISKAKEEKIIIIGNDASGKTTLLYQLKLHEVVNTIPTIGFNIETVEHKKAKFTFWDVGGCDQIRPLWRHYIGPDFSVLYIHNVTDDRIDESIDGARIAAAMMESAGAKFMWILFTKQDLLPSDKACNIVSDHRAKFETELLSIASNVDCQFVDLAGFSCLQSDFVPKLLDVLHTTTMEEPAKTIASAGTPPVPPPASESEPTEAELIARIETERANDMHPDFWNDFLSGGIAEWNHRSHLHAGYILLLESLQTGESLFECADAFLSHLRRLKQISPERFRNTEHRTMTIFWLHILQLATLNFKTDKGLEKYPSKDLFDEVLLHSPILMYGGLWKQFYTKDLMMSQESKEYWRLPDLAPLPDFAEKTFRQGRRIRRMGQEEPFRLMRFAFAVVKKYLTSDVRRGWLVQQSLAALQTSTMRRRAQNPDLQPYSETQAYFWIQLVHASLAGTHNANTADTLRNIPVDRLSFSAFRVLFDMQPSIWRNHYTPSKWDSLEARAAFVLPNLQPLPNVISIPSVENVLRAYDKQIENAHSGLNAELPSMEELAMQTNLLLHEVAGFGLEQLKSANASTHAQMVYFFFNRLSDTRAAPESVASRATAAMLDLGGTYANMLTLKSFWAQLILASISKADQDMNFEQFIWANPHLAYSDLAHCYFSPELLQSLDAKERIVAPDRRTFESFVHDAQIENEESDWVVL